MVKNSRKTDGAGDLRPMHMPRLVGVKADELGRPLRVRLIDTWVDVRWVVEHWRIDDEWWREEHISRSYYTCFLDGGHRVTIFQNLLGLWKEWYRQTG